VAALVTATLNLIQLRNNIIRLWTSLSTLFAMHFISLSSCCLSLLASSCWASAPPLLKARQFTNHYIAVASNDPDVRAWYPCSEFKRQRIEEAMVHTWAMAQAATAALNVANAESSSSYCSWFGIGALYIFASAVTC
jgi:hypothetical protein